MSLVVAARWDEARRHAVDIDHVTPVVRSVLMRAVRQHRGSTLYVCGEIDFDQATLDYIKVFGIEIVHLED